MADEEVKEKKKGGILKWIILVVILLLLAGGGYFAYTMFFAAPAEETAQSGGGDAAQGQAAQGEEGAPSDMPSQVVTLPTFLVNLADPLGRRYLKLTMDIEVQGEETAAEVDMAMPKIRDAINLLLSSKSYSDLAPLESKLMLKNEIVSRLNQVLGGPKVSKVYFTEMVIQ